MPETVLCVVLCGLQTIVTRAKAAQAQAPLSVTAQAVLAGVQTMERFMVAIKKADTATLEARARDVAFSLSRLYMGALLLEVRLALCLCGTGLIYCVLCWRSMQHGPVH